jgi:predicted protein tyrosine phosphatase
MKQFLVMSRQLAEVYIPSKPYIVISITDPEMPPANLPESKLCKGVLRLSFHDIDKPWPNHKEMTREEARQIVRFVKEHLDVDLVICHCEAGISRSAGVAAALSSVFCQSDKLYYQAYMPNSLVRRLIVEEFCWCGLGRGESG